MPEVDATSSSAPDEESLFMYMVLTPVFEAMLKQAQLDNDDDPDRVAASSNSQVNHLIASSVAATLTGVGL